MGTNKRISIEWIKGRMMRQRRGKRIGEKLEESMLGNTVWK
jgi:hypothetical protein